MSGARSAQARSLCPASGASTYRSSEVVQPRSEIDERQHTEHGLERKQQLLDAAGELFAARGYSATRIADICQAAGVAKGLFYWYFENKEALFAEVAADIRLRLRKHQGAGDESEP